MVSINMGLNTQPPKTKEAREEIYNRFIASEGAVPEWRIKMDEHAEALKQQVIDAVEAEGSASLNWSCNGATLFEILAYQWAEVLPQYRFEFGRYRCIAHKK